MKHNSNAMVNAEDCMTNRYSLTDYLDEIPQGYCQSPEVIMIHRSLMRIISCIQYQLSILPCGLRYLKISDIYTSDWEAGWSQSRVIDILSDYFEEKDRKRISRWINQYKEHVKKMILKLYDIEGIKEKIEANRIIGQKLKGKLSNAEILKIYYPRKKSKNSKIIHTYFYNTSQFTDQELETLQDKHLRESQVKVKERICTGAKYCSGPRYCPCKPVRKKFPGVSDEVKRAIERPKRNSKK